MKFKQLYLSILALSAGVTLVACGSGSSTTPPSPNAPILSVMPWQNLGESVMNCQTAENEKPDGLATLIIAGINSSGVLAIGAPTSGDFGCKMMPFVSSISNKFFPLQIKNAWIYDEDNINPITNPMSATLIGISDNNVTTGYIQPITTGPYTVMAAIGNTTTFTQLNNTIPLFNAENLNHIVYAISSNGNYALGSYDVFSPSDHKHPETVYSYLYNVNTESYNFNINTNQFGFPYSRNAPNMIAINNSGVSAGVLDTNDFPLSKVGVFCNASGECNVIPPSIGGANIIESGFGIYAINNTNTMLGQEDITQVNEGVASQIHQIKFYNATGGALLKTLDTAYSLPLNAVLTDDNVTLVEDTSTGEPYYYSLSSDKYFNLVDVINQATGWDENTAINEGIEISGTSQNGYYIYGTKISSSPSGGYRVPFTIYFNKGLNYYLNNTYQPSVTTSKNKSVTGGYKLSNNLLKK